MPPTSLATSQLARYSWWQKASDKLVNLKGERSVHSPMASSFIYKAHRWLRSNLPILISCHMQTPNIRHSLQASLSKHHHHGYPSLLKIAWHLEQESTLGDKLKDHLSRLLVKQAKCHSYIFKAKQRLEVVQDVCSSYYG